MHIFYLEMHFSNWAVGFTFHMSLNKIENLCKNIITDLCIVHDIQKWFMFYKALVWPILCSVFECDISCELLSVHCHHSCSPVSSDTQKYCSVLVQLRLQSFGVFRMIGVCGLREIACTVMSVRECIMPLMQCSQKHIISNYTLKSSVNISWFRAFFTRNRITHHCDLLTNFCGHCLVG
jgi:hypothetical protein